MKKGMIILCVVILVIAGLVSYDLLRSPTIFVYVSNKSFDLPSVDLKVQFDSIIVADTLFIEKEGTASGNVYELPSDKGLHLIQVSSVSQHLNEEDTFEVSSDRYILVDFYYKQRGTHRYENARDEFDRLTRRDPEAVIKSDTIETRPTIRIRVTDEKPDLVAE